MVASEGALTLRDLSFGCVTPHHGGAESLTASLGGPVSKGNVVTGPGVHLKRGEPVRRHPAANGLPFVSVF